MYGSAVGNKVSGCYRQGDCQSGVALKRGFTVYKVALKPTVLLHKRRNCKHLLPQHLTWRYVQQHFLSSPPKTSFPARRKDTSMRQTVNMIKSGDPPYSKPSIDCTQEYVVH